MRFLVLLAFLPGCFDFSPSPTEATSPPGCALPVELAGSAGDQDHMLFSFGSGWDVAGPLAANGTFTVVATDIGEHSPLFGSTDATVADSVPTGLVVRSSNPTVGTVTGTVTSGCLASSTLALTTLAPGTFDLQVVDATGSVYESISFDVEQPVSLGLANAPWSGSNVLVGSSQPIEIELLDANGGSLYGPNAVQLTFDGVLAKSQSMDGDLGVVATSAGTGRVIATNGSVVESVTLTGVDTSAIDGIQLGLSMRDTQDDQLSATASAIATTGGVPVYGAVCAWSGVPSWSPIAPSDFIYGAASMYSLAGPVHGYTATCTIPNGISQSILVHGT